MSFRICGLSNLKIQVSCTAISIAWIIIKQANNDWGSPGYAGRNYSIPCREEKCCENFSFREMMNTEKYEQQFEVQYGL